MVKNILESYANRRIFLTGHTGFKGSWMCRVLSLLGAKVVGYSLEPPTQPNLHELIGAQPSITTVIGDISDLPKLTQTMNDFQPEIVIHMAAQPLVRESYKNPVYTYQTNVMGTVNLLEACRHCGSVKSILNVTTDKVYYNREWDWGYREIDPLDGRDPYSNSKSCSELVTHSYAESFFNEMGIPVSTARAGNVIGGGDFSADRIIPDCVRAIVKNEPLIIRNPLSTRPYQHVLEPVFLYLRLAMEQLIDVSLQGAYNIGPGEEGCTSTEEIVELFARYWGSNQLKWRIQNNGEPHESNFLKLDSSKIQSALRWRPIWNVEDAIERTVIWTRKWLEGCNITEIMDDQIKEYLELSSLDL